MFWRTSFCKEVFRCKRYLCLDYTCNLSGRNSSIEKCKYFPWFLQEAHKNNCRVHGLAFTSLPDLQFMPFDSVDSSSWKSGPRFARPALFNGHNISNYDARRTEEKELCHNEKVFLHDFIEWKKLAVYMDKQYEPIWE